MHENYRRIKVLGALFAGLSTTLFVTAAQPDLKKYVGMQIPPLPTECKSDGGGLINDDKLAFSRVTCDGKKFIWLERGNHSQGKTRWTIVDAIQLPELAKGQELAVDSCDYRGDHWVFAIGTWKNKPAGADLRKITFAMRINLQSQRLEILNPRHVQCGYNGEDRD